MTTEERDYAHLVNLDLSGFVKSYITSCPRTGKTEMLPVAHPFYEGLLSYKGEQVIFFLQKPISDLRTLQEVEGVIDDVVAGQHTLPKGAGLLERHFVPRNVWNKEGRAISAALFHNYAPDAEIVIPGIVTSIATCMDKGLVSKVRSVPEDMRPGIERFLRTGDFMGPISYKWL